MPKVNKKKKAPITSSSKTGVSKPALKTAAGTSANATRTLIRRFHVLLKREAQLKSKFSSSPSAEAASSAKTEPSKRSRPIEKELADVQKEMEDLGGLEWYQRASTLGQSKERGGDSSHVLVSWLKELGVHKGRTKEDPLRILEIGALSPSNYAAHSSWIANTPLDLHSQHPLILEQDFLQRPVPEEGEQLFDVVSCSLVLNFVPVAEDRGRMLLHTRSFLPQPSLTASPSTSPPSHRPAYLFLVLPTPCVLNSRFFSTPHLTGLMDYVGYSLVRERFKGDKGVTYWLFERVAAGERKGDGEKWRKKRILEDGGGKNNFSVVLPQQEHK